MSDGKAISGAGSRRRLAAIMAADIAGYSRLMGTDEEGTLARLLRQRRDVIEPTLAEHHGALIKTTGDGYLAMFDSPVEAVRCAIVIQQSMVGRNASTPRSSWIQYRIGVNLGDVIVEPDDIFGDGVNVAVRLQTLAEPGGVLISGGVYEQIKNKIVCGYQSLGDERLKNITDPVRVYRVLPDPASLTRAQQTRRLSLVLSGGLAAGVVLGVLVSRDVVGVKSSIARWSAELELLDGASVHATSSPAVSIPTPPRRPSPATAESSDAAKIPPPDVAPSPPLPTTSSIELALPSRSPEPAAAPPPKVQPETLVEPTPVVVAAPPPKVQVETTVESTPAAAPTPQPTETVAAPVLAAASPRPPPDPAHPIVRDCADCPELIELPGGSFAMGSNDDPSEAPVHPVSIGPFAIGRFAVTLAEWKACVAAKSCEDRPNQHDGDRPVDDVSWDDAQRYVAWLSSVTHKDYRLPSEALWEYAARAGSRSRYWWGPEPAQAKADCRGCGGAYDPNQPTRVGAFPPNAFGLYDMAGGVEQWTADCWRENYRGAPKTDAPWTAPDCRQRVLRGGSWENDMSYMRVTSREAYDEDVRYPTHGLRVARLP